MIGIHKPVPKEPVYSAVPRSHHEEKPFHLEQDTTDVGIIVKSNKQNRPLAYDFHEIGTILPNPSNRFNPIFMELYFNMIIAFFILPRAH